jgi:hypothetical protein
VSDAELLRALDGFLITQLLYVAAKLGLPDALADGPRGVTELADAAGVAPGPLARVLRGLAAEGIVCEDGDGRFGPGESLERLRRMAGMAVVRGELYYGAAAGLLETLRDGEPAFERVYGEPFFAHLAGDPALEAAFNAGMAARSQREATAVLAAYDFGGLQRLVDVGGGSGVLLTTILDAAPRLRGVLVDRPAAVDSARERLARFGARAECVEGDFFDSVPAGADAYLLSRVIHDWDDEPAARILATCRAAMPQGARLLLVEAVLPRRAADAPEAIRMDLQMLILFGARERTAPEYEALLARAGLTLRRVVPTGSPTGLAVIEALRPR